jgi:hypothetical protein
MHRNWALHGFDGTMTVEGPENRVPSSPSQNLTPFTPPIHCLYRSLFVLYSNRSHQVVSVKTMDWWWPKWTQRIWLYHGKMFCQTTYERAKKSRGRYRMRNVQAKRLDPRGSSFLRSLRRHCARGRRGQLQGRLNYSHFNLSAKLKRTFGY